MKKNKNQGERKPDINSGHDQNELEARIDDMLQVSPEERKKLRKSATDKAAAKEQDSNESTQRADGPPALPTIEKKKTTISVTHHDDEDTNKQTKDESDETPGKSKGSSVKAPSKKPKITPIAITVDSIEDKDLPSDEPEETVDDNKDSSDSAIKSKAAKKEEAVEENAPEKSDNDDAQDESKPTEDNVDTAPLPIEEDATNDADVSDVKPGKISSVADNDSEDSEDSEGDSQELTEEQDELAKAIAAANEQLARRKNKAVAPSTPQQESNDEVDDSDSVDEDIAIEEDIDLIVADTDKEDESSEESPKPKTMQPDVKPGMVNIIAQHIPTKPTSTEKVLEDGTTDKVVEQIIANEGDDLLAVDDEKKAKKFAPPPKPKRFTRLRAALRSKKVRLALFAVAVIGAVAAFAIPASRYTLLNVAGVRSGLSITVVDQQSLQPLRGVMVSVAGQEQETDKFGVAQFERLELGASELRINKRAFAEVAKPITVGWGSNPLGEQKLVPTGSQYIFIVKDFLSEQPLKDVEAMSGEYYALSDEQGKITLTVDEPDEDALEVEIIGDGYRTEKLTLDLDDQSERELMLVAGRRQLFVSKRSGTYDLYAIDADGKNEEKLLPGTGSERDDMTITPHPVKEYAAFVSTRDNKRNDDGFLLSTLTIIDTKNNTNRSVVSSERIQIIDWIEDRLIYVRVSEGASASNPRRHRLISYDVQSGESTELAAHNYFNDVTVAKEFIYFAPAGAYAAQDQIGLFRTKADGSNKQRIYNKEVWNMFRLSYDSLTLASQNGWLEYRLDGQGAPGVVSEPPVKLSRAFVPSPDGNDHLWVDNRDGKGVLLVYNTESNEDTALQTIGGLRAPVRWLNSTTVVYRIVTGTETADYVMSMQGGEAQKITDVTNTNNYENWYYY